MPHGNAIADTDGRELQRRTAGGSHAEFRRSGNLAQMDMPGNHLIERVANANQRLLQILRTIAHGMKQGTVSTARRSLLYNVTSHKYPAYLWKTQFFTKHTLDFSAIFLYIQEVYRDLELNSFLRTYALLKRMLYEPHFRHEIGAVDDSRQGVPPRQYKMKLRGFLR